MRQLFLILIGFTTLIGTQVFALSEFKLNYNLPARIKLQLIDNQEDSVGYTRRYQVITNEKTQVSAPINLLTITHDRNVKFTPEEAMQEVLQVHEQAQCAQKNSKIIKVFDNVIIFSTLLTQCANGKSVAGIYKSFSTASGQYGINYSVDPNTVSQKTITSLQNMVKAAKIIPIR